jgi:hypothetical protein
MQATEQPDTLPYLRITQHYLDRSTIYLPYLTSVKLGKHKSLKKVPLGPGTLFLPKFHFLLHKAANLVPDCQPKF